MSTLNKERKNKASMLKTQLTTEQHVFLVKTYYKTSSYLELTHSFPMHPFYMGNEWVKIGFPQKISRERPSNK